jgi:hypothetical protein
MVNGQNGTDHFAAISVGVLCATGFVCSTINCFGQQVAAAPSAEKKKVSKKAKSKAGKSPKASSGEVGGFNTQSSQQAVRCLSQPHRGACVFRAGTRIRQQSVTRRVAAAQTADSLERLEGMLMSTSTQIAKLGAHADSLERLEGMMMASSTQIGKLGKSLAGLEEVLAMSSMQTGKILTKMVKLSRSEDGMGEDGMAPSGETSHGP